MSAAALLSAGCAVVAGGCFYNESGLPPPTNSFYYPTGLAVSPGRSTLYVANSDFDLQYNAGTVQALQLGALRATLATMLAGVRCSEGTQSACTGSFASWGAACGAQSPCPTGLTCSTNGTCGILRDVCNSFPESTTGGSTGAACTQPSDCTSANCTANGVCAPCTEDSECYGGMDPSCPGKCAAGVCQLTCVSNDYLTPSACSPIAPPFVPSGIATIGAFASGAVIAQNPAGGSTARLFVPVRGDPSITWFNIPDDSSASPASTPLDCGQASAGGRCSDGFRIGVDPYDNFRDETLPVEPVGIDISNDGADIVTAHQIPNGPAIGLSLNSWNAGANFQFALTTEVATGPTSVGHIPEPKVVTATAAQALAGTIPQALDYEQGFLVTYDGAAQVDTFRVDPDPLSSPPRPFLTRAASAPVTVNQSGTDSRGIAIDPTARQSCESACDSTQAPVVYDACLTNCTNTPLGVYIANRAPPSLLLGEIATTVVAAGQDAGTGTGTGVFDTLTIYENVAPLPQGPSTVAFGQVIGPGGSLETMVFVVSFDTRRVNVYDPVAQTLVSPTIVTGRGPQAIAFDACTEAGLNGKLICAPGEAPHAFLIVGHFTDSYLGVVDLDMTHPETFGSMFASIGIPVEPVETQ